jgi:hypothetical protein
MQEASTGLTFSEDAVTRAFQAANAFRDALQSLVTVARSAGFTVGMEADDRSGIGNEGLEDKLDLSQKASAGGKDASSG